MSSKSFDLNIEKILENWEVRHGIRELIANALDEQILTETAPVEITKHGAIWRIRDYGRGIRYTHLTQKENQEKLEKPNVIGRFGIGLKDALATFERHDIRAEIRSKFGTIYTVKSAKHGFGDIKTLHAVIDDPLDTSFVGTEIDLIGAADSEMESAKDLFLKFSNDKVLDTTRLGQIISRRSGPGAIYINGVKVAEEANFLFSYNITLLNAAIKKAINRERTHVGRTAYTDSVKKILLASSSSEVARKLSEDISRLQEGTMHDELDWVDVQEHAVRILNAQGKVILVTATEAMAFPDLMDQARGSGMTIFTIPENLRAKIADSVDLDGNRMVDLTQFTQTYNDSFIFDFIDPSALTAQEREVFDAIPFVIDSYGGLPSNVESIMISNTMRPDLMSHSQTLGCWDSATSSIVISRSQLSSFETTAGVLIHEMVHAKTGFSDVTRDFETELTTVIGTLCHGWRNAEQAKATPRISKIESEPTATDIRQGPALEKALRELAQLRTDVEREKSKAFEANRELDALRREAEQGRTLQSRSTTDAIPERQETRPWFKFW